MDPKGYANSASKPAGSNRNGLYLGLLVLAIVAFTGLTLYLIYQKPQTNTQTTSTIPTSSTTQQTYTNPFNSPTPTYANPFSANPTTPPGDKPYQNPFSGSQ